MRPQPTLNNKVTPLVSITVHNYNYGRYLRQCFDSIIKQSYPNIEICFSDNASTDDSWEIALEYMRSYPGLITGTRNRQNFGPDANIRNCAINIRGAYFIELCSDDALEPHYVEICVKSMEAHPDTGFVMVHRAILDEHGHRKEEAPFYNGSYLIPGPGQAAVYMLASVNPSISQIMYRTDRTLSRMATGGIASNWYGQRILDFRMCCDFDMLYIDEPLLLHRMHGNNDADRVTQSMLELFAPYILQHQFKEIAETYCFSHVIDRLPESLQKLSRLSLRYCLRALRKEELDLAHRYFHLSIAIWPGIVDEEIYIKLKGYWDGSPLERSSIIEELARVDNLIERSASYPPPLGSKLIDIPSPAAGPLEGPFPVFLPHARN